MAVAATAAIVVVVAAAAVAVTVVVVAVVAVVVVVAAVATVAIVAVAVAAAAVVAVVANWDKCRLPEPDPWGRVSLASKDAWNQGAHVKVGTQSQSDWQAVIVINHYQPPQITVGQSSCDTQPDIPTLTCAPEAHMDGGDESFDEMTDYAFGKASDYAFGKAEAMTLEKPNAMPSPNQEAMPSQKGKCSMPNPQDKRDDIRKSNEKTTKKKIKEAKREARKKLAKKKQPKNDSEENVSYNEEYDDQSDDTQDMFKWKKANGKYNEEKQFEAFSKTIQSEFKKDPEMKNMKDLEMAFFPIIAHEHYYLVVFNFLKGNTVIIDNSKTRMTYDAKYKTVCELLIVEFFDDAYGALQWGDYKELEPRIPDRKRRK
ncbi:hypothetical protein Tco_0027144 [Tanacetum coccineum]